MSPTGFEPVTPPLKVECSKTNWATKTLSKWQGSNLRPESPKLPALPTELHLVIFLEEEVGVDPNTRKGTARFQDGVTSRCDSSSLLLFPKGSNLDSMDQNHVSCRLDEGTKWSQYVKELFLFVWGSYQVRTDDSGLQSRGITKLY